MSVSTKTVIVLDHSINMARKVQHPLVFDNLLKNYGSKNKSETNRPPSIKVYQTLWSCATEAISGFFAKFFIFSKKILKNMTFFKSKNIFHFLEKFSKKVPKKSSKIFQKHSNKKNMKKIRKKAEKKFKKSSKKKIQKKK